MNYHKFSYLPSQRRTLPSGPSSPHAATTSSFSIASSYVGRAGSTRCPIRVTPSALPSLICTILYSIEFQAPTGPRPLPEKQTENTNITNKSNTVNDDSHSEDSTNTSTTTSVLAAAALPSSVMFAVSALFGRSPAPSQQQNDQTTVGDTDAAEVAADRAQLAARRRMRDLPLVVPVTQVIHKLGGVYLVVRQTHCASVEAAKERALRDVRLIVEQHKQQQQQQQKSPALPSQRGESMRVQSTLQGAASANITRRSSYSATVASNAGGAEDENDEADGRHGRLSFFSPSPSSELSRSVARPSTMFDPSVPATSITATSAAAGNAPNSTRTSMYATSAANAAAFDVHADELGMELAVRLLTRETRWRMSHERPLAEWTFPIIRTKDEDTIMYLGKSSLRTRMSDQLASGRASFAGPVSDAAASVNTSNLCHNHPPRATSPSFTRCSGVQSDFVFVNDASQVHDVLQFILKTFYEAISMETFADFASGELVFDARVKEKRSFYATS